jgi:hypothetical protein
VKRDLRRSYPGWGEPAALLPIPRAEFLSEASINVALARRGVSHAGNRPYGEVTGAADSLLHFANVDALRARLLPSASRSP